MPTPLAPRHDSLPGAAVLVALAALYAALAPAHVLGGDNAEFATIAATGGVAHPSGYPLYTLYLRATAWLPGTPAHAAALATAGLGLAQLAVLLAACRAWGARPAAAAVAVAAYGAAPLPLLLHTQAEVFALNGLLVAAIAWLAADEAPRRGLARVATLGLLAGLALANHLTAVLVAPLGVLGVARGLRESGRPRAAVAVGVGALALGLLPYLWLLAPTGPDALVWGELDDLPALLAHALRRDYGTTQLGVGEAEVAWVAQLAALARSLVHTWWVLLPPAGWALLRGAVRPRGPASRGSWLALAASLVLAGPVLLLGFNLPPEGLQRWVVERFHLLPATLLVVPAAVGLGAVAEAARRRLAGAEVRPPRPVAAAAVALAVVATAASLALPGVRAAHAPDVERYLRDTLATLPADAVLIGDGDHQVFGFAYLQRARGLRRDAVYVAWPLTWHGWYRRQLERRLGFPPFPDGAGPASARLVAEAMRRGRPVFVDGPGPPGSAQARLLATLPSYPVGTVIRLLPPGTPQPALEAIEAENLRWLEAYGLRGAPPPNAGWPAVVRRRYVEPWAALARAYGAAGRPDDADRAAAIAEALAPAR